ncbi:MAG: outer membrane lipoprotein-sorting protein [Verrucomicrobia bacterium]|nr:outer membrane lipoprotein-sorting protein [Verrucomicrobiota bacterium]
MNEPAAVGHQPHTRFARRCQAPPRGARTFEVYREATAERRLRSPSDPRRAGCQQAPWLCLLALGLTSLGPNIRAADPAQEGRALAEELRAQRPTKDSRFDGALQIRDRAGHLRRLPVQLEVVAGDPEWRGIYRAFTPDHQLLEQLTVVHTPDQPNRYLLDRAATPTAGHTGPPALAGAQATNAFAGSDFSLADLGLEFIHWPGQRVVKHEMRKGRACQVLESLDPHPAAGGYTRVLSWVDLENQGLVRAEAYDWQNRLLKEFEVDRLRKVNGRWELKEVEIRNLQTGSRTHLIYNTDSPTAKPSAP